MSQELTFGHNLFGYTTLVREGTAFVALTGDGQQELRVGMTVVLLGDSRGYVPSGFSPGDEVTIMGFTEPFKNGESDHIIKVGNASLQGWVKPSNIQRDVGGAPGSTESDKRHQMLRKRVHPAAAELLDVVYLAMSNQERRSLPDEIGSYVNELVAHALRKLDAYGAALAEAIARLHAESVGGERFIMDPIRSNAITSALLFLDPNGELISVKNPEIVRDVSGQSLILKQYESYEVLTGPSRGRKFPWRANALGDPIYRHDVATGGEPIGRARPPVPDTALGRADVFISYKREEREKAEAIAMRLKKEGYSVWWDAQLLPGDRFHKAILDVIKAAKAAVVLWSKTAVESDFIRDEASCAKDLGILIPVRLEECEIPLGFRALQTLDLSNWNGDPDDQLLHRLIEAAKRRVPRA